VVIILFMFFGLGIGIIIMQILSAIGDPLPYTVVVFMAGLLFSLMDKNNAGLFGESVTEWVDIDADLLLFTFLPPLIFGEAMSLNFYHVKGGILQATLLAGPGVLMGAALMGVITKYMLPYNWNWNLALTFGAILSATDPVAVVALLKSAGASPKLTILIVGESLMNDGTAMVLFTIFYESLNGRLYTPASITYFFAAAAFGSVLLGLFCGFLMIRWLRTAHRPLKEIDTTIQIAITVTCAYLIFFTAQYVLKISGVLACCGAGIVLAWLAPPIILNQETMHHVWGMIEWTLNTLIFLLAGLIIGNRVINKVEAMDWFYVVVLYALLMVIRLAVIAMLFPWLSTIGHKCTMNEAIFMSWAGLRGALGMALALIVEHDCPDHLAHETSRMFFYVGGIAALTMLINATTANQLLHYLGLLGNDSAEKNLVMQQIKKRLKRRMDRVLVEMAAEFSFTEQDLDEVRESCSLLADANMENVYRDSMMQRPSNLNLGGPITNRIAGNSETSSPLTSNRGSASSAPGQTAATASERNSFTTEAAAAAAAAAAEPVAPSTGAKKLSVQVPTAQVLPSAPSALHSTRSQTSMTLGFGASDDEDEEGLSSRNPTTSLFMESENQGLRRFPSSNNLQISSKQGQGSQRRSSYQQYQGTQRRRTDDTNDDDEPYDMTGLSSEEAERVAMQRKSRASGAGQTLRRRSQSSFSFNANPRTKSGVDIVRMLSMANRTDRAFIEPQLLTYVRAIFLEILRVRYWHDIERGKIPRLSHSAKFLLYSVEVGADLVDQDLGVQDWRVIKKEITSVPLSIRLLSSLDSFCGLGLATYYVGKLEARREKRAVYMLTSFIDAHMHAQQKVHEFIVEDDHEEHEQSPEELKVIEESMQAVEVAKHLLNAMSPDTVAKIRAKQAAALVLTKQAELIKTMVGEGLLTTHHAEEFLEEISDDLQRMDKDRNKMYWEQGEKLAKKRQALKAEEQSEGGRGSLFSMFEWPRSSGIDSERDSKDELYLGPNSFTTATVSEPLIQSGASSYE